MPTLTPPTLAVIGSFILHFVGLGILYSSGLYVLPLTNSYSTQRQQASLVSSMFTGSMLLTSLTAGRVFDNYYRKMTEKNKDKNVEAIAMYPPIMLGGFLTALGLFSLSYTHTVVSGILTSFLIGTGASLFAIPSITIVQSWFTVTSRATATGFAMAGSGLGNSAYAIFISKLLEYYDELGCEEEKNCEGWRSALRIEAGVSLVLVLSASCLIKRKSVGKTDGDNCEEVDLLTFRQAVQTRPLLTVIGFKSIFAFAYLNFFVHIVAYCEDVGLTTEDSALALSLIGCASIAGRVIIGLIADRFGTKNTLILSMVVLMFCVFIWTRVTSLPAILFLSCCYGFFAGGFPSLPPSIIAEYYGKVASNSLFQVIGVNFFLETPGATIGPSLVGYMFDVNGTYEAGSYLTAGFMIVGVAVLATIPSVSSWDEKMKGEKAKMVKSISVEENEKL
ncbi:hypothetical protein TL16_g07473 [Triparma laevis f. inornata]|uniref:Major facilitator superfamily (MFS) profile domain-containing protein n=1 Tax=Triparma laevis f. inornata TaxID=1714386 RepID=A0A9W7EI30_9STRA|nr:hypothetical protein TL16_g07473 [Triparma laevis f. inornata]